MDKYYVVVETVHGRKISFTATVEDTEVLSTEVIEGWLEDLVRQKPSLEVKDLMVTFFHKIY